MPCVRVPLEGGGVAIVCGVRRRKDPPCRWCGKPAPFACDGPAGPVQVPLIAVRHGDELEPDFAAMAVAPAPSKRRRKSTTCDAPLCRDCALEVGPDRHMCPDHRDRR